MRYMIMSGTSDATKVINFLNEDKNNYILATTVTDYGSEIAKSAGATEVISKALCEEDFIKVIKEKKIDTLIDATHPFAAVATETAIESCEKTGINYIRYERASTILPKSNLIYKVPSFIEGAKKAKTLLKNEENKLMHLAGVMTLSEIVKEINPNQVVVRVLPNTFSITKTQNTGIPAKNIIAMQGTYSKEFNMSLMKEYNVTAIITKESGESGGAEEKINAALELNIPVVLVTRPHVKKLENHRIVRSIDELKEII
ncbi:precorrin-6A reductase [Methanosphaera sp. WGK6]|uniref:precorrin-6A reductase n=1 Tax=Methanosphaera sp. WGK6 TaxID=1561964 RepID=UPI00084C3A2E|nr:precorrin-6A reductase [Methanosphaera sp. WGK6]OED30718.1 precorrin-6X reductase [Methanosphaera sp. WGK6]